jgi:uncharacterized protein
MPLRVRGSSAHAVFVVAVLTGPAQAGIDTVTRLQVEVGTIALLAGALLAWLVAEWARLELGGGPTIWLDARARFLSQVAGPHFESICRDYAMTSDRGVFGGLAGEVGSGVVPDPANRTQIEVDVVVLAQAEHGGPRKVLSLGEAKLDRVMGLRDVERLRRARHLLTVKGLDTRDTVLTCYSGAGFGRELQAAAGHDIHLVGLDRLYDD